MPQKIIYIMSLGHSGSTILELLINRSFSEVTSLGEVQQTFDRRYESQNPCTCGEQQPECPVWGKLDFQSTVTFDEFYNNALAAAGSGYVTDSSKSLDTFRRHYMTRKRNCCVVLLRKDLVAFYESARKRRAREAGQATRLLRYNFPRVVLRWLLHNYRMYSFLRKNRIAHMTTKYQQVCNTPAEVMKNLAELTGMQFESGGDFSNAHLLRGNKTRFDFIRDPELRPYIDASSSSFTYRCLSRIERLFEKHLAAPSGPEPS